MNYRLSPEVKYPEHICDVLRALQWVHREIHKLLGVVGISGVYNIVRLSTASIFGSMALDPVFGHGVQVRRESSVMQPSVASLGSMKKDLPMLLLYAQDDFHLDEDAIELKAWLNSLGFTHVACEEIPGTNHFTIIGNVNTNLPPSRSTQAITKFIRDVTTEKNGH
ncbi:hypothetical protein DYB37_006509 [Aphanomyces astaci]|uniref:Alpha/beta hydrolase fold-3 domain-containing protein n=3 Tax=Aphanomyces astaci TaxID=112090 RepID=A0A397AKU8_APHAT|nr:hypothetical protein DYB36_000380 [Aphanomyces astaci]RHY80461.1 hypothetical protein DYB35_005056 [Aphanomyces astaci]RHZ27001.1 hypothetical protein DYB37_006509 [Aphanomyces astaci]